MKEGENIRKKSLKTTISVRLLFCFLYYFLNNFGYHRFIFTSYALKSLFYNEK